MPGPKMSGLELGGRLIALEATVIALAGEITATLPADKAQAIFAAVKAISHDMVDQLAPEFSPTPPAVKDIAKYADQYADVWVEMIEKVRAKILKDGAVATVKTDGAA